MSKFKVQVIKCKTVPSRPYMVRTTHNGWQWMALHVTRKELVKIKKAIGDYLKEDKK